MLSQKLSQGVVKKCRLLLTPYHQYDSATASLAVLRGVHPEAFLAQSVKYTNNMNNRTQEDLPQVWYFDYKDSETLEKYLNPHGRISGRRHTRLPAGAQRQLARAIKNARFMGFLPYVVR